MNSKLTLRLDETLIDKIKQYAAREGRSVSGLVADYFDRLQSGATTTKTAVAPERRSSFHGLLANTPLAKMDDAELKVHYRNHLAAKHA